MQPLVTPVLDQRRLEHVESGFRGAGLEQACSQAVDGSGAP
jgi:hypothetical protein